jgi:HK97 family phage major capsid protein
MAPEVRKVSELLAERIAGVEAKVAPVETTLVEVRDGLAALKTGQDAIAKRVEDVEAHAKKLYAGLRTPGVDRERPVNIARLVCAIVNERRHLDSDPWKDAGYEREVVMNARSTMVAGTDSLGGYVVPQQYLPQEFVDSLWARTVLAELGVRRMPGLVGAPVLVPKKTGNATAYYAAEGSAPTGSNPTVGMLTMYPRKLSGLVVLSKLMLQLSAPAADQMIRDDLARVIALRRELAVLQGTGGDHEPRGLVNTSGVGSSAIDAAITDLDDLEAMVYTIESANADKGSLAWLMNPREWSNLRTMKDGTGRYLLSRAPDGSTPKMLHGYPVLTTTQVPITLGTTADRGRVIFGNWADLVDGEWGGVSFDMSDQSNAWWEQGLVGVLATLLHDVAVRQPSSFVVDNTVAA